MSISHMEKDSLVVHPSNHHIGAWHLSVGRHSEAHPALRPDADGEGNAPLIEVVVPVELVALVQSRCEGIVRREIASTSAHLSVQQQNSCRQQNESAHDRAQIMHKGVNA